MNGVQSFVLHLTLLLTLSGTCACAEPATTPKPSGVVPGETTFVPQVNENPQGTCKKPDGTNCPQCKVDPTCASGCAMENCHLYSRFTLPNGTTEHCVCLGTCKRCAACPNCTDATACQNHGCAIRQRPVGNTLKPVCLDLESCKKCNGCVPTH